MSKEEISYPLKAFSKRVSSFSLECFALAKIDVLSQDGRSVHIVVHQTRWPIKKLGFQAGRTEHYVMGAAMLLAGFTEANLLTFGATSPGY